MSSGTARVEPVAWPGLSRFSVIVLPAYAAAIVTAELVTALVDARWGVGLHVVVLWTLFLHFSSARESSEAKVLLALCLAPLIRILSLAMPLEDVDLVYWFLIVNAPVLVAAALVARTLGLTRYDLGLTVSAVPLQLLVGAIGVGLGVVEYLILKPDALVDGLTWQQAWLAALILLVATGFGEELVFRGVMQSASADAYGKMAILWVAVVFAALHVGYKSVPDVAFAFIVGLFFGWVVARTRSLLGVGLCHGVLNVMLYVIVPFTALSSADLGAGLARLWTDWAMTALTLVALGVALLGTFYLLAVAARAAARKGVAVIGSGWEMAGLALAALGAALLGAFSLLAVAARGAVRRGAAVIGSGWEMAGLALAALGAALLGTFSLLAMAARGAVRRGAAVIGTALGGLPTPSAGPLTFQVSGIASLQGLLDLNRALNRTPAVGSTTVRSYYGGEATIAVALSAPVRAEELVANWSRLAAITMSVSSEDQGASVVGVKVRPEPSAGPLTFQVSGISDFQGLLDLNHALSRTPAVGSTTVRSYYGGEATIAVALSAPVRAEELVANWSRLAAITMSVSSEDQGASVLGVKVRPEPFAT